MGRKSKWINKTDYKWVFTWSLHTLLVPYAVHTQFSMESNKDEALRCLSIAHKHRHAGNLPSALKFVQKSISLFSTPEAVKLLAAINSETPSSSTSSATESHPSASGAHHRHTASTSNAKTNGNGTAGGIGGEKREYTQEQHAVVKRVRGCKVTQYYEILEVKKECEEVEIKKAYRKVSFSSSSHTEGPSFCAAGFGITSRQERRSRCR